MKKIYTIALTLLAGAALELEPQPANIVATIAALRTDAKTFFFMFFLPP